MTTNTINTSADVCFQCSKELGVFCHECCINKEDKAFKFAVRAMKKLLFDKSENNIVRIRHVLEAEEELLGDETR